MTPHLYHLNSTWRLPARVDRVWAVITDLRLRPGPVPWWPGCELTAPLSPGPSPALETTTAHLEFRSGLGYRLHVTIRPRRAVAPRRLDVDADGDLAGTGRLLLTALDDGPATRLDIEWTVRPSRGWMIVLSPILAPVFVMAHRRVMRRGERGLVAFLRERR